MLSAIPVALFIQISEPLFVLAFGKAWREAGALASFLIIQYVLLFCSQTVSYCRVTIEKQRINLLISIMQLIVAAVSCSVGYSVFGEMKATVMCFSLGQCIYNICDMAVNFACMNKKYLWKYLMISVPYVVVMMFIWLARQTVSI